MEYTASELREMDDDTARSELTVEQYERREKVLDLLDDAAGNQELLEEQDEQVRDIVVNADPEQLGTGVDLFGNDALVRVDPDDDALRERLEHLDSIAPDAESTDDLDTATTDELAAGLRDALDRVLLRWNGHEWDSLGEDTRTDVLAECRRKWGVDGLLAAWLEVAAAIAEEQQDRVDVIESFRSPERRGRR